MMKNRNHNIGKLVIYFITSLLSLNSATSHAISIGFLENSRLWAGATLRWGQSKLATAGDALSLMTQYRITPKLNTGFAYDLSINGLQQQTAGTFELLVSYCLNKDGVNVNHPRFFR